MYKCVIVLVLAICAQAHKYGAVFPEDTRSLSDSRIIDGSPAAPGQFPYQGFLAVTSATGERTGCGGSLISQDWVLTAGHCITNAISVEVHLGSVTYADSPVKLTSTNLVLHPNYHLVNHMNDIALIGVPSLTLSDNIRPIALPTNPSVTYAGRDAIISGFGSTVNGGNVSPILKFAPVRVITNSVCLSSFPFYVRETVMCTIGVDNTAQGICQGDRGGPLVLTEGGVLKQIGIATFSRPDCNAAIPKGYVRTYHYLPWIRQVTGLTFN